jgi:hypothetical protein
MPPLTGCAGLDKAGHQYLAHTSALGQQSKWSTAPRPGTRRRQNVTIQAAERPFNEGAAQVRRLLSRDKRELTGLEEIGQRARAEFDEDVPSTTGNGNGASMQDSDRTRNFGGPKQATNPFASSSSSSSASPSSPFGAAAAKPKPNPFGTSSSVKPFIEPSGLSPTMKPEPLDQTPWYKKITFGQVVVVISFSLIIGLMLGTFAVVVNVGGVRFNE